VKIFFDNNVPAPLRRHMLHHQVSRAWETGWATTKNGTLLRQVEVAGFDVMVTGDKNIKHQQNLAGLHLAMVVLGTTRWKVLQHHTVPVVEAVDRATPGSYQALPDPTPPKPKPPRTPGPRP